MSWAATAFAVALIAAAIGFNEWRRRPVGITGISARTAETGMRMVRLMYLIEELRAEEADSVTIFSDNADFSGPQCAIECCGFWTEWKDRRFSGDTLLAALEAAVAAKRAFSHA